MCCSRPYLYIPAPWRNTTRAHLPKRLWLLPSMDMKPWLTCWFVGFIRPKIGVAFSQWHPVRRTVVKPFHSKITQWFWFFAGTSPNTTYTNNWWNGTYDGVGACNEAIALGDKPPYTTEEERNAKIAEARFLRAVYYFNAVEQFGAVTMLTEPITAETLTYSPTRTELIDIA